MLNYLNFFWVFHVELYQKLYQNHLHLTLKSACLGFYLRSFHTGSSNSQQLYAPPEDTGSFLSTIRQQYIKHIYLTPLPSFSRIFYDRRSRKSQNTSSVQVTSRWQKVGYSVIERCNLMDCTL